MTLVGTAQAQWVSFVDETQSRLSAAAPFGSADTEEKDYAWGDVDRDGDIDLVVVRKEPFTTPGKRPNRLFLNEGGVLVDRTVEFASASDVAGDQGFLTPTNDRDVVLVDVDGDGWLDIVTATTISDGDPKHIGHPRIYRNLGEMDGNWLGFRLENARIPAMRSYTGQSNVNPRFCSVAAGDLNGDDAPDLYFGDYDAGENEEDSQPPNEDYNDRLLLNDGSGFFSDATQARFSGVIDLVELPDQPFELSSFGAAVAIADMNSDGFNDIVKQTSLQQPIYVGVAYNSPDDEGFFDTHRVVTFKAPYFISIGDLNNDNLPDIVVTDDGADFFMLNQGNDSFGLATFIDRGFTYDSAGEDGFGGNSVIADLNNDGWNDVLIADVDVDTPGCDRRMHIYRNLGGTPGANVNLRELTDGLGCGNGNPSSCLVASIPASRLVGVHDVAVFDINGDDWQDLVVGRCDGTQIYINQPPEGLSFAYPQGLPALVPPGSGLTFQVQLAGIGGVTPEPGAATMFIDDGAGGFNPTPLTDLGDNLYEANLPMPTACAERFRFYFTAQASNSEIFSDPAQAPASTYEAVAALGTEVRFEDDMEGDVSGWTVVNDPSLTSGGWERAQPFGTLDGLGMVAAPNGDAEAALDKTRAFVTQNGAPGGQVGAADVDGGPTDLISPAFDLTDNDATITYSRWFYTTGEDRFLEIAISNDDGQNWTLVENVAGSNQAWQVGRIKVSEHVTPTANVRVRFRASDSPNSAIVEAGIDLLRVETFVCGECTTAEDCDDGVFCNGAEACDAGSCVSGADPCPGQQCDEGSDTCVTCLVDADCADDDFCNGQETCDAGECVSGSDPCPGQPCNEGLDACVECSVDADCDDGLFCNGIEACSAGSCTNTGEACPDRTCDEAGDTCVGQVRLQARMGQPLTDLTADQLQRFLDGQSSFNTPLTVQQGLGPIFNQSSCGNCHARPLGGSGTQTVTRFAFNDDKGGGFDPLAHLGGSLRQARAIRAECAEEVPVEANVVVQRLTNSTLGFGLVEAIPDAAIEANALFPTGGVSGRVHLVEPLEQPGTIRVGRFGWKSQVATVLSFSADAALNEMGLTNRLVTTENAPNGDMLRLAECDDQPDPEDGPDAQGRDFIDRVTDFQRFLAPPPQTPRRGMSGEALFNNVGCASCHTPSFVTADDSTLEAVLRNKVVKPYSDFLLHDMGQAADFIAQGDAGRSELRTPPLWGLRLRDPLWHDGRVLGGTFAERVTGAIDLHNRLGSEGQPSAQAFAALPQTDQDALIAFLDSLGRAEFDHDGDGLVNASDFAAFQSCRTGPGLFYTPDDACSLSDVDQDGDVDDDDFDVFLIAASGQAGRIPDNAAAPGTPLTLDRQSDGGLKLDWGASCLEDDTDYAIYQGTLGQWTSHTALQCSTAGSANARITPSTNSVYYLIVPHNGFREGSYGDGLSGTPRIQSLGACLPQSVGACSP